MRSLVIILGSLLLIVGGFSAYWLLQAKAPEHKQVAVQPIAPSAIPTSRPNIPSGDPSNVEPSPIKSGSGV